LSTGAFLVVETANTYLKVVQKIAFKNWYEMLPFALYGIVLQYTLQWGQPSHHPSVCNIKAMLRMKVRVLSMEVPMKAKFN